MTAAAMVLAVALPLALAPLCLAGRARSFAFAAAPWAALPALLLAIFGEAGTDFELPALLLGTRLALDQVAWTFLLCTSVIGLLGGGALHAMLAHDPRRFRFAAFYLAGFAGTLGAILAYDLVTFYAFFALLSFAAYGFVIHEWDAFARRAARIYIVLAVLAEGMLLAGLLLVAAAGVSTFSDVPAAVAGSPYRDWIIALLLGGFGVKAGLLPWHVSLPPAYAASPVPGGVLLGGAMINAGLLGWLRLLPFGTQALPAWGALLALAGLGGMFYGVAVGLLQARSKAVLAYSSISQMGFMLVALGLALLAPSLWPAALAAVLVYATHHALVKSTLFVGVGLAGGREDRRSVIVALLVPALMLAGLPFTTGAVAKFYLKEVAHAAPGPWSGAVGALLPFGALGTALLLARFLLALRHEPRVEVPRMRWLEAIGIAAFGASWLLVALLPQVEWDALRRHWMQPFGIWQETWPVLAAAALALLYLRFRRGRGPGAAWIAPGDIVVLVEGPWRRLRALGERTGAPAVRPPRGGALVRAGRALALASRWHGALQRWSVGSLLFLLAIAVLLLLLVR